MAKVYVVGDSAGWTSTKKFDYKRWSTSKHFQIDMFFEMFLGRNSRIRKNNGLMKKTGQKVEITVHSAASAASPIKPPAPTPSTNNQLSPHAPSDSASNGSNLDFPSYCLSLVNSLIHCTTSLVVLHTEGALEKEDYTAPGGGKAPGAPAFGG
ncbi:hypothetical protein RND71_028386 [Anisodus tanguticus]|uniref:Phytocyanin domain-containing protein n=1 Tax=Anisodus tanguticus TaxID=243964 RepID=A0AAE1V1J3_9SOLA|nr:hypothetical protein RND71_028386 [Anisodus tanguticus]